MKQNRLYALPLLIAALALGFAQTTFAAATPAGTVIANQASVSYEVSGLPKTELSTITDFTVDSKIDLTVANTHVAAVSVLPATGATEPHAPMKFIITNTGNEILDMSLLIEEFADATGLFGETDNDANDSTYQIFVDIDGDRTTYNATNDTATSITDLAYDDGVSAYYNTVVWVIPNFDDTTVNNDTAVIALQATVTAYNAANTAPSTAGANVEDTKGSVMNDTNGPATADNANDAIHSDDGVFKATAGAVTTTKSISGAPTFYIPGETVTYTLSLANTWGVTATSVVITDDIDDQVSLVCGDTATGFQETSGVADGFSIAYDDDGDGTYADGDVCGADGAVNSVITSFQITITNGIDDAETKSFTFNVVIE